jgi:ectoine hydroxylase-related dioxygenase (phytanoyl-CoA dioxygenase family)
MAISVEEFDRQGFTIVKSVLSLEQIEATIAHVDSISLSTAGTRNLLDYAWCSELVSVLRSHPTIAGLLPLNNVAVQCTLFEKTIDKNWLVPLHQDLSIPVREHCENIHLSGWSHKEGIIYVQPPIEVLEKLVAIRVHIDDCNSDNGALRVVPASHDRGRISPADIPTLKTDNGEQLCTVKQGGALVMRPLLLHASSKANIPNRRRVLHFLFGSESLPLGLEWDKVV